MPKAREPKAPEPIRVSENPFGEFPEEQLNGDTTVDRFYLEGYSDKRHERDLEMREAARAGRPANPKPLPYRFQFVSVEGPDKKPTGDKELEFRRRGYRPVTYDEAANFGLDLANSGAKKGPDGNVRVGTQMLMVADARTAARNYQQQQEATRQQLDGSKARLDEVAKNYNAKHGHSARGGTKFEHDEEIIEQK